MAGGLKPLVRARPLQTGARRVPVMLAITLVLNGCMTIEVPDQMPPDKGGSQATGPAGTARQDASSAVVSGATTPAADSPPVTPPAAAVPVVTQGPAKADGRGRSADRRRPDVNPVDGLSSPLPDARVPAPIDPPAPQQVLPPDFSTRATEVALGMLGRPYRLGGITPAGFDCSGLLYYSFGQLGVSVPRDTQSLRDITNAIPDRLRRIGDLVFFHIRGRQFSHVGLYVGEGRFLHAPSSGGEVRIEKLSVGYWQKRYAGTRRLDFVPAGFERR